MKIFGHSAVLLQIVAVESYGALHPTVFIKTKHLFSKDETSTSLLNGSIFTL